jgi:hypothetical protein
MRGLRRLVRTKQILAARVDGENGIVWSPVTTLPPAQDGAKIWQDVTLAGCDSQGAARRMRLAAIGPIRSFSVVSGDFPIP